MLFPVASVPSWDVISLPAILAFPRGLPILSVDAMYPLHEMEWRVTSIAIFFSMKLRELSRALCKCTFICDVYLVHLPDVSCWVLRTLPLPPGELPALP